GRQTSASQYRLSHFSNLRSRCGGHGGNRLAGSYSRSTIVPPLVFVGEKRVSVHEQTDRFLSSPRAHHLFHVLQRLHHIKLVAPLQNLLNLAGGKAELGPCQGSEQVILGFTRPPGEEGGAVGKG